MSENVNAKPPFLRRVRIRNFKSIAYCDVTLEPLTILVGRNGTGSPQMLEAEEVRPENIRVVQMIDGQT